MNDAQMMVRVDTPIVARDGAGRSRRTDRAAMSDRGAFRGGTRAFRVPSCDDADESTIAEGALKGDLLIAGGRLVGGHDVMAADLALADGRVAAILEPGAAGIEAERRIDASGKLVL